MQDTPIIMAADADIPSILQGIKVAKVRRGQKYHIDKTTGLKIKYLDIITAFDIETSKHQFGVEAGDWKSWMYIWQWQFGEVATVIGRTWDEFRAVVDAINEYCTAIDKEVRLMCFVHNLSFEFQFLSGIWRFDNDDIFATDVRSILYCKMGQIELRCSYRLSNYNLFQWAKELRADHQKMLGDLDYSVERYPDTELTPEELRYCVNDVICVVECVKATLESYGDTFYSMPYTSTGYIRRMVKKALRMWCADGVKDMQNSLKTYDRLREAFRGGDTHANRWHVNHVLGDVHSYDRSSSYPDVICHCKFPMSRFVEEKEPNFDKYQSLLDQGRAIILKVRFRKLRLIDEQTGDPYIPKDKCSELENQVEDNGRILSADVCCIAVTDIDYEIIQEIYTWEGIPEVVWMESARYGFLPRPLIDVVIKLYHDKTAYKGQPGMEIVYAHSKALLNATYGMMCQRLITNPITFDEDHPADKELWRVEPDKTVDPKSKFDRVVAYTKAIDKAFLNYAWATWVTAWARFRLFEGIRICEKSRDKTVSWTPFAYCDTDSVKSLKELDFSRFNDRRIRDAKASGAWANDAKGKPHYMGVFEDEGTYDFFGLRGLSGIVQCAVMI